MFQVRCILNLNERSRYPWRWGWWLFFFCPNWELLSREKRNSQDESGSNEKETLQARVSYPLVRCCVVLEPSSSRMSANVHLTDSQSCTGRLNTHVLSFNRVSQAWCLGLLLCCKWGRRQTGRNRFPRAGQEHMVMRSRWSHAKYRIKVPIVVCS